MASTITSAMLGANTHAVAGSTKLAATNGGAHIFNIKASANTDNGSIIGRGAYSAPEYYAAAAASTTFAATVIGNAANGNYYVEVTKCDDKDCLVLTTPLIYEQYSASNADEKNFFNAKDDIMRCYQLVVGDVFEISKEGISGTVSDSAKTLKVVSGKLTVA